MTARAVLYARTSGDDRGKGNIEAQLVVCRDYASRQGYMIVEEISESELGASGAATDLPGRERSVELAEEGAYDILVVRDADRLARAQAVFHILKAELLRAGVRIESTTEGVLATSEDEEGEMGGLFAWLAERERKRIARRTKAGRRNRVVRGGIMVAGRPPYGYRAERVVDPERGLFQLIPNEDEARVVRMVFGWFAEGTYGLADITRKLSELGIATPADLNRLKGAVIKRRGWGQWNRSTVHTLLRNDCYIGTWTYGKDTDHALTVAVPALVDLSTWDAVQTHLETNRRNGRRPKKNHYLMSGRLRCGHCGAAVTGCPTTTRGRTYLFYVCNSRRQGHTCSAHSFRVLEVDDAVWQWVRGHLVNPDSLEAALTVFQAEGAKQLTPITERLQTIEALLTDHRGQMERLLDLYVSGGFAKDTLAGRKARIESAIDALEHERAGLRTQLEREQLSDERIAELRAFAADLAHNVDLASARGETRRAVIEALDVRATLAREEGEVVIYATAAFGHDSLSPASTSMNRGRPRTTPGRRRLCRSVRRAVSTSDPRRRIGGTHRSMRTARPSGVP